MCSRPLLRLLEDETHLEQKHSFRKPADYWMSGWNQELPQGISQAHWLHNSDVLVTGTSEGNVVLWNVVDGNPLLRRLAGHKSTFVLLLCFVSICVDVVHIAEVSCLGVSNDDSLIASGGDDGTLAKLCGLSVVNTTLALRRSCGVVGRRGRDALAQRPGARRARSARAFDLSALICSQSTLEIYNKTKAQYIINHNNNYDDEACFISAERR
jgi:hypothetical protein